MKRFALTIARRDDSGALYFKRSIVEATSRAAANNIGKALNAPENKVWFRADLTREVSPEEAAS